jgi:hypothetical protein
VSGDGQFVFGLRPHPAAWLPVRPLADPAQDWLLRWGDAEFRLRPDPRYGVPYGQDRLVVILLVTAAVRQRSPRLVLPTAFQMLRMFGLPPSGRNYERWQERLARVLRTGFSFEIGPLSIADRLCQDSELWFESTPTRQNHITLSGPFWEYVRCHYLPLELRVVQQLSDSPSVLDFYAWLADRAYRVRPDRYARVPFFGRDGLAGQLGALSPADPRDFRKRVRTWVAQLRDAWLSFPGVLPEGEDALLVCRVQPPPNWGL